MYTYKICHDFKIIWYNRLSHEFLTAFTFLSHYKLCHYDLVPDRSRSLSVEKIRITFEKCKEEEKFCYFNNNATGFSYCTFKKPQFDNKQVVDTWYQILNKYFHLLRNHFTLLEFHLFFCLSSQWFLLTAYQSAFLRGGLLRSGKIVSMVVI
jgi:hypothetical protein